MTPPPARRLRAPVQRPPSWAAHARPPPPSGPAIASTGTFRPPGARPRHAVQRRPGRQTARAQCARGPPAARAAATLWLPAAARRQLVPPILERPPRGPAPRRSARPLIVWCCCRHGRRLSQCWAPCRRRQHPDGEDQRPAGLRSRPRRHTTQGRLRPCLSVVACLAAQHPALRLGASLTLPRVAPCRGRRLAQRGRRPCAAGRAAAHAPRRSALRTGYSGSRAPLPKPIPCTWPPPLLRLQTRPLHWGMGPPSRSRRQAAAACGALRAAGTPPTRPRMRPARPHFTGRTHIV